MLLSDVRNGYQPYYSPMGSPLSSAQLMSTLNAMMSMVNVVMSGQFSDLGNTPFPAQRNPGFGPISTTPLSYQATDCGHAIAAYE